MDLYHFNKELIPKESKLNL